MKTEAESTKVQRGFERNQKMEERKRGKGTNIS